LAFGALGFLLTTAAAGQALGPVLAGSAGGNVGVVASQNLFFIDADAIGDHSSDIDQAAAVVDSAGQVVTAAFRVHRGDSFSTVVITVENRGDTQRGAELTVTRPTGVGVDLFAADPNIGLAQMGIVALPDGGWADNYLLSVEGDTDGDIELRVRVGTADALGSHPITLTLQELP
jgi:hypothetical protein